MVWWMVVSQSAQQRSDADGTVVASRRRLTKDEVDLGVREVARVRPTVQLSTLSLIN